jgi:hypothetical protein
MVPASIELTSGLFRLAQSPDRRDTPESTASLAAWQARRPRLAHLDMADPQQRQVLEARRLRGILRRFARGVGWAAGGSVRVDASGRPVAFESRPSRIGRRDRSAIRWLSNTCGLRAIFNGQGSQEWVLLAVRGVDVPEFTDLVLVLRAVGVDPATIEGLA